MCQTVTMAMKISKETHTKYETDSLDYIKHELVSFSSHILYFILIKKYNKKQCLISMKKNVYSHYGIIMGKKNTHFVATTTFFFIDQQTRHMTEPKNNDGVHRRKKHRSSLCTELKDDSDKYDE